MAACSDYEFGGLLLATGNICAAGHSIRASNELVLEFSDPFLNTGCGQVFLVVFIQDKA